MTPMTWCRRRSCAPPSKRASTGPGTATGCRRGCAGRPARSCASTASVTGTRTWPQRGRRVSRRGGRSPRPPRQREATPLSEPVRAALGRLTPGERRAIQLRYIDGLNPDQAAEIAGVRKRSLHRRVADGRRKLAAELADLAPPARSPLQELPRREAITRALAATTDDVPAAAEWLRKQGVHASEANLYRYRQMLQAGEPLPGERATPRPSMRPAYPAYTPPEHVTAVGSALERARAAGIDYRTRFGRLPTRREVMDAVGVSESTATRALRPLKAQPDTRHVGSAEADESTSDTSRASTTSGIDRAGIERGEPAPAADDAADRPSPPARCAPARRRPRTRGGHSRSARSPIPALGTPYGSTVRSATSATRCRPPSHPGSAAAVDTYASTRTDTRTATHTRPAPAAEQDRPRRHAGTSAHPAGTPPQRRHRQEHRRSRRCRSFVARGRVDRPRPGRGRRAGRAPSRPGAAPAGRARPRRAVGPLARRRPTRRRCPLRC